MPRFLIITPTFPGPGRARKLESAIASVQSQLFKDHLHIVVGDGPTPDARDICKRTKTEYAELPAKVEGFNWGCPCRNYALDHYDGERCLFLDDDNLPFLP